jgi:hypothetical protein
MRTAGQPDMTKLLVAFRNIANAPKSEQFGKVKQVDRTAAGVVATGWRSVR